MKTYIKAISYYLPEMVLDNESINHRFPEWGIDKISSKTGVLKRHIANSDEFVSNMATSVANKLFEEHSIDRHIIDFIVICTQSPDYILPTTACIVQDKLGLNTSVGALDINLGCSGYVYGLAVCKGLISAGVAKNILLITSETYSKYIHPQDKSNLTIFGDAASASLISNSGFAEILNFELGSDGKGSENLIVRNSGLKFRSNKGVDRRDEYGNMLNDDNLFMNGPEIFNFTSEHVPKLIDTVLLKNNKIKNEINQFVLHQANKFILDHLRKKLNIPADHFYINLTETGNTVSSSIPIALKQLKDDSKLFGDILICGFGVGYSWGGVVLSIKS